MLRKLILAAALAACCVPALAQTPALTVTSPFWSYKVGDVITDPNQISLILTSNYARSVVSTAGSSAGGAAPSVPALSVVQFGSTGADFSASPAIVTGSPLITIPATPGRSTVEVQNQSLSQLQVVRDDGAGGNQTSIMLAPAAAAGGQGGGWTSATFKGRVRVYGPAGAQVGAYQD